ncbi:sugar ABC transporter substrate-binding protein [Fervidibacillus halotolerans]|uniref:Maltodextrin-binding protein n=1 Tax=Fervidibacillus halotolerans TaxID=2980027 RepID=A0A9E8M0C5_9BACI|nr:extracellular solute-binding protein [Fervidibacillus halotolerans]WAA13045.1 extracellular solute-binding protein [Fervidibacillus halotolerans]
MKKALSVFLVFLLMVGILSGCGPDRDSESKTGDDQNTNNSGEEVEKPDKLVVWVNDEEKQKEALEQIFNKYTEETGIEIEMVEVSMLDQIQNLSLDGPAGKGPDVFFQPHDRIGDIVLQGLADPIDLGDEKEDYSETAISAVTYDGETYGAPLVVETYGMFYNKDRVSEAPKTFEELQKIADEQTNASNEEYGFLMEAANLYFIWPFFASNGAYIFKRGDDGSYDTNDIGLANEGAKKAGEIIRNWFDKGQIPVGITPDIMNGLFKDGKVSVVINGPWMAREYQDALGDKLGISILPEIDGNVGKSFVGVKSWMLSAYSENKEWAVDFMKFITNKENSLTYFEIAGEMPANEAALTDPLVTDDPIVGAFAEQVQYGEPMPSVPEMQQVWEPANKALELLSKGEDTGVLDEAVDQIKANIIASGGGQ